MCTEWNSLIKIMIIILTVLFRIRLVQYISSSCNIFLYHTQCQSILYNYFIKLQPLQKEGDKTKLFLPTTHSNLTQFYCFWALIIVHILSMAPQPLQPLMFWRKNNAILPSYINVLRVKMTSLLVKVQNSSSTQCNESLNLYGEEMWHYPNVTIFAPWYFRKRIKTIRLDRVFCAHI